MKKSGKKRLAALLILIIALQATGCGSLFENNEKETAADTPGVSNTSDTEESASASNLSIDAQASSLESRLDLENAKTITLHGDSITAENNCAAVSGTTAAISAPGTYIISGTLNDGQIYVNCSGSGDVYLVLNHAHITCSTNPAIYVKKADTTYIVSLKDTVNSLADGTDYVFDIATDTEPDAALFSKKTLVIGGSGTLNVTGSYRDGIKVKNDLLICEGTLNVTSADDGIKGRDSLTVSGGDITVEAGNDGLKTTNADESGKGTLEISGGAITINSVTDGVQAEQTLNITGGTITVTSGGGSSLSSSEDGWGMWGNSSSSEETASAKGLKAYTGLTISGGKININASDDAVHCNADITIDGGELTLASGDDGIHADDTLNSNGGTITITESYEGLEAGKINIKDGSITVAASDDGLNAGGGSDGSGYGAGGPQDNFSASGDYMLNISGGTIYVNAGGDGLDSNGELNISGGTVLIDGPTNGGNGALDHDGNMTITGGLVIAAGASGMAEMEAGTSGTGIYGVCATFTSVMSANTLFTIQDSSGNAIVTYAPSKQYQNVVVYSADIKSGSTYTVHTGGTCTGEQSNGFYTSGSYSGGTQQYSFTPSSATTYLGSSGGMGGGPGGMR